MLIFRIFSLLVLRKVKYLSYFYLLDVLLHTLLDSSFSSHIPLLVPFNLGSFLYRPNFCKAIRKCKAHGKPVVASLLVSINAKTLHGHANN